MNCKKMKKFTFISLILSLLVSAPTAGFAQADNPSPITVKGVVTDDTGAPLSGVTVITPRDAAVTNSKGEYSVSVPGNGEMTLSFLGYTTQIVNVNNRAVIDVSMQQDTQVIDDVIVVAYGTTTRKHIISAVGTVKSDAIENRPVANVQQALQGAAANLIIQTTNFDPTNSGMNLSIRGVNTIGNNSPMVVIDGVPQWDAGRMNDLNPNDIANISILKDAGSAAIYGARSSNGVILITTKGGKKEMKPQVRFSAQVGAENPNILYEQVPTYMNSILRNETLTNVGREPFFTAAEIQDFYDHGDGIPAYKVIMQNALQQNYNLSVTGGSQSTTYMLSAGYFNQGSNYIGNYGTKRYNVRSNLTTEFGRLKIGANINYTRSEVDSPADANLGFLFADAVRFPAYYFNRHVEDGIFFGNNYKYGGYSVSPAAGLMGGGTNKNDNDFINGIFTVDFDIYKGLKAKAILGGELRNSHRFTSHRPYMYAVDSGADWADPSSAVLGGATDRSADDWVEKRTYVSTQLMLEYNRTFAEKHNVSGLFGWSQESNRKYALTAGKKYLNDIDQPTEGTVVGENTSLSSQGKERSAIQSFFGRAAYSYDDRYYFEFTARYDQSSKFLQSRNAGFFPAVSLGWRISEEAFMEGYRERAGDLKLRMSYGLAGNQQDVGNYDFLTTYGIWQNAYGFNGQTVPGMQFTLGNELLTWEKAKTFNIGADLSFFRNSLNVSFDYFNKRTVDILLSPITAMVNGAEIAKENRGILKNQGWEMTVNYNLARGAWNHSFALNLADSMNELVSYGDTDIHANDGVSVIRQEGLPLNSYYGYKVSGFFRNYDEIQDAAVPTGIDRTQLRPGDVRYVDLNKDGKIDDDDRTYLGYGFPRYTFGFNYNVAWKGIDVGIMLQGVLKRTNAIRGELVEPFHSDYAMTMFEHQLDYWAPDNMDARWPRLSASGSVSTSNNWGRSGSELIMIEGAYLRVKDIQVGYTFPKQWTKKFACESLRIYFSAQNALTLTKNGFVDPETTEFGSNMSRGGANSVRNYPTLRYFGGGIDLTF